MARTQMLVVGGGVIGASIAYYSAKAGVAVTLVEQDQPGQATSATTARAVRAYFPERPDDTRLAVASLAEYKRLSSEVEIDPVLVQTGFMVVLNHRSDLDVLVEELRLQRAAGVEVQLLSAEQAMALNPWVERAGIVGAVWSPQAYTCDPQAIIRGWVEGARAAGACLLAGTEVLGIDIQAGRVRTTAGEFVADAVVCAAGPWSAEIAGMAGVTLAVTAPPAELMRTGPVLREVTTPFTLHIETGLRTRQFEDGFLIGMGGPKTPDMRAQWHGRVKDEFGRRYPSLANVGLRTASTGVLDLAPDRKAFIGRGSGQHARWFYAAGFSGHGLCQAPIAGQVIRDMFLNRPTSIDIAGYSLNRQPEPPSRIGSHRAH